MIKLQNLFIFFIITLPSIISQKPITCNRSCPGSQLTPVPYPFGFSPGCQIQLNCTSNGTVLINEFQVQQINPEGLFVSLLATCGRPVHKLKHLYGEHYAPTSTNAILMQNCTEKMVKNCMIPATMLRTHLEIVNCSGGDVGYGNVSCYSSDVTRMFLDYDNVAHMGCRFLLTGVATEMIGDTAISLDIQMVKLGWWLKGSCEDCSSDANCTTIVSPADGSDGYRCKCRSGFDGDGYKGSSGCRRLNGSSGCNASKYLFGHCGGTGRVGVLIGAVVVGASLIICIGLVICFIRRRTISRSRSRVNRLFYEAKGITVPIYTYKDIEKATNNFSDKQRLGTGAYGTVYSGKLQNGEWVAIKRIKHRSDGDNIEQVINEIKLLSSVSHPNLVRLLGCSVDKDEQILVYEFMPNGTLSQHLQRERGNGLPWPVRLIIATETAQAIAYLHSNLDPPIYHRDVKSSNILLDYDFKTKVADFGLSRLGIMESSHISTAPQGTPGYLDPEYHQNFHLSDKSDVYSFGVVLIEIITACKALDFSRRQNEVNLASLAVDRIKRGSLEEIIDPSLEHNQDEWTFSSIHKVAEIAFRCLAFHSEMRPSMSEVAADLEEISISAKENIKLSLEESNRSLISIVSEKETNKEVKNSESDNKSLFDSLNSMNERNLSTMYGEDQWPSEPTSPSSNGLLGSSTRM
uniref:wall-associated receptor kinase-like 14 n=1 Tax=Erigeron canadensis TaxID=72917 RepID=UPI001CB8905C|nr:wall-associated receptor kinase-like 14 [Erigeron canadensis]